MPVLRALFGARKGVDKREKKKIAGKDSCVLENPESVSARDVRKVALSGY